MKKLLALILATLMLCSVLAACSAAPAKDDEGNETPTTTAPAAETEPEETEPEETEPDETEEAKDGNTVAFGTLEGNLYTNEYAGFQLELDDTWTLMTAEQLQELPENVTAMFEDTAIGETMKSYTQFIDMQATNVNDMSSVNVVYQVKDASLTVAGNILSEEQILDATLAQKDVLISSYAQAGIEVESIEKVTMEFLGRERFAMKTSAKVMGVDYCMVQLFDYSIGDYGVVITIAAFGEEALASVIALFQPLS